MSPGIMASMVLLIYNLNNDQYMAFELTDPNHVPQPCSSLVVKGTEATCSCDDGNEYTIITGTAGFRGNGNIP